MQLALIRHAADAMVSHPFRRQRLTPPAPGACIVTGHSVGVVFSGGGARAFAQIGAIQALREAHIPIDFVPAALSMGVILIVSAWRCNGRKPKSTRVYAMPSSIPRRSTTSSFRSSR